MTLNISGLTVTYDGAAAPAVADVNLTLALGEVVALLGPSGCGKSSLLRAVAGLETPASGRIAWDGADLAGVPTHQRGFGLLFQEGQLFPHRNVGANVAFGLEMAGLPRAQRRERVEELLDLVGMPGYANRSITTLSGGEQQRVSLARSLAPRPKVLLLDEPLSALDRHLREHLAGELAEILRSTHTTALYVTHDHDEAFTVADRVALMRGGQLIQVGTPAEVWAAPVDAETAEFLGYRIVTDGDSHLGLGPRALHIKSTAAHETRTLPETYSGVVVAVALVRGESTADVDIPGWGRQAVLSRRPVAVGETVELYVQADQIVRFRAAESLLPDFTTDRV